MAFTSFQGAEFAFETVALAELGEWSKRAIASGRVPCAYLRASWCGANVQLEKSLGDERMARALREVAVAVFDVDDGVDELMAAGLNGRVVPVFFVLDGEGKPTGQQIHGGAWKENTPENMAPPLERFFDTARARRAERVSEAPARGAYAAPVAAPVTPTQPSRVGAMLMVVLGLGALVAGAWWKVSSDEQDSRAKADEEQRDRIRKDVDASIQSALKKK
jgi:hypothetical protein